jgi:pimeloyl-ACP methyl ester carboxylesterase
MVDCIRSRKLLLLPGMMCDLRLWRHQADALAGTVAISFGDITGACSVEALAARVLANAPDRFALAGLSMGGIVALEMWRQAPQRVERLALLDTNYRADTPQRRQQRNQQITRAAEGELKNILRNELKPNYLAKLHRNNTPLLDEVLAMGIELGESVFIEQSAALRDRPDSTLTLATIECPTLVLCGDEDQLCPVELHRSMAQRITGAHLDVIENCGHLSTLEQPAAVNQAMYAWLNVA